jgi:hypothetical protein
MAKSQNISERINSLVCTLTNYVKGVQIERGKGMIETQSGEIDVTAHDRDRRKFLCHLKAIRVKDGKLQLAYNEDSKVRYKAADFKKESNWKPLESTEVILEPTIMEIIGSITKF